jgi:hypothetical protein
MPRKCLFCGQPARSKEHLWPVWIRESLKIDHPIRHAIGKMPPKILKHLDLTCKCVCRKCNNGWMSGVESAGKPILGPLMQDISIWLDSAQRSAISVWAMKTAMAVESVRHDQRRFYSLTECEQLRLSSSIPDRTDIWIGRVSGSSIATVGTDFWINSDELLRIAHGLATTIVVGHLAIQILTVHPQAEYQTSRITFQTKRGPWNDLLTQVWPSQGNVEWPPNLTITQGAGPRSFARLVDRWRIGAAV